MGSNLRRSEIKKIKQIEDEELLKLIAKLILKDMFKQIPADKFICKCEDIYIPKSV